MSDNFVNPHQLEWGEYDLAIPLYYKQWDIFTALRQAITSKDNEVVQNILGIGSSYDGYDLNTWPVWSLEKTLQYLDMCGRSIVADNTSVPIDYKTNFRYVRLLRYILDNNLDELITGSMEEEEVDDWGLEFVYSTLDEIRSHHFNREKHHKHKNKNG
jgi:hypothetical protein